MKVVDVVDSPVAPDAGALLSGDRVGGERA